MKKTLANTVIAIVGPTASGKSDYAIELAKMTDGEIVSADSRLVYRGFDIGTAKPTIDEQAIVPHHMIDIVEPEFEYSAGLYKYQANQVIDEIIKRGKTPIVVGGTGLYIDILLKNYDLPQILPNKNLRLSLNKLNNEELFEKLKELDSSAAEIIDINDRKKVIRAIEIIKATGLPLDKSRSVGDTKYNIKWIGKNFERKTLYDRINKRVDIMIEKGLINETKGLLNKHGRIPNLTDTIGYKEIISYLDGVCTLSETVDNLKQNTRRYAKRQLTWFRKNPNIEWDIYPDKLDR